MTGEEREAIAEATQRDLDAELTPDEQRLALVYLCGYAPAAVRAAVAAITRTRPDKSTPAAP